MKEPRASISLEQLYAFVAELAYQYLLEKLNQLEWELHVIASTGKLRQEIERNGDGIDYTEQVKTCEVGYILSEFYFTNN